MAGRARSPQRCEGRGGARRNLALFVWLGARACPLNLEEAVEPQRTQRTQRESRSARPGGLSLIGELDCFSFRLALRSLRSLWLINGTFCRPSGTCSVGAVDPVLKHWAIVGRPCGTWPLRAVNPALKRWAIFGRPGGTACMAAVQKVRRTSGVPRIGSALPFASARR